MNATEVANAINELQQRIQDLGTAANAGEETLRQEVLNAIGALNERIDQISSEHRSYRLCPVFPVMRFFCP